MNPFIALVHAAIFISDRFHKIYHAKIALVEKEDIAFLNAFVIWAAPFAKEGVTVENNNAEQRNVSATVQMPSVILKFARIALDKGQQRRLTVKIMEFWVIPSKRLEWEDQQYQAQV